MVELCMAYILMLVPMTLMQGGSTKAKIQRWIISKTKQAISIQLATMVGHVLSDLEFASIYMAWPASCFFCCCCPVHGFYCKRACEHLLLQLCLCPPCAGYWSGCRCCPFTARWSRRGTKCLPIFAPWQGICFLYMCVCVCMLACVNLCVCFIIIIIVIIMKKNFNTRDSHGHHGSRRRELAQHAHWHRSHTFTHTLTSTQLQPRGAKRQLSYVCVHMCVFVGMCVHGMCVCACVCARMCVFVGMCLCVCLCACIPTCVCVCVCWHLYVFICWSGGTW